MGRPDFPGFCPYLRYIEIFGNVNKTCRKQGDFTGNIQLDAFQNKFPTGNGSVPSLACDRFIFCNIHSCRIQHF